MTGIYTLKLFDNFVEDLANSLLLTAIFACKDVGKGRETERKLRIVLK
jgi:hypothetical protein